MGCGCGKKGGSSPSNFRGRPQSGPMGIMSDIRKSRQIPNSTLRTMSMQRQVSESTRLLEREKVQKIRQRIIRERH